MAQRKITINLPGLPEVLHELMFFLLQRALFSEKEAQTIKQEKTTKASKKKKSRWELAAERLDSEGFLDGQGEKVKRLIRDDFNKIN